MALRTPALSMSQPSKAGLAPVARQSGKRSSRAFIRGGRSNVRHATYMPALMAIRFNPQVKANYEHLRAAGKPAKVTITAIMCKPSSSQTHCRDGRKRAQLTA
ncbi:transposase [Daeguia caeni]|uniref:Transposase n=1 Tax=Daeguia caeni TaxID=439612 RepID=A0ABV9H628_9HYPH